MRTFGHWVVVLVVFALSGCGREGSRARDRADAPAPPQTVLLSYERIELPGFSVEIPAGGELSANVEPLQYIAGSVRSTRDEEPKSLVAVNWEPGGLFGDEDLDRLLKAALGHMGALEILGRTEAIVAGRPARRISARDGDVKIELVQTTCGARVLNLQVLAPRDPAPIAAHMGRSLDCRPDPARETELSADRSPVAFDGLSGWNLMADTDAFTIEKGDLAATFVPLSARNVESGVEQAFGAAMKMVFGDWHPEGTERVASHGRTREIIHGHVGVGGEQSAVAGVIYHCPGGPAILGIVVYPPGGATAEAMDVLQRSRCLGPGEEPPSFEHHPPGR